MKNIFLVILVIAAVSSLFTHKANAQQTQTDSLISTLQADAENSKTSIELLNRLKISGYIQAQWQLADTAGAVTPYSGGVFPIATDNRFAIRRGRIKFAYEGELSKFVLQIDATEKGVTLKDAYIAVKDPWSQFVTLTAGVFNRPFGHEVAYSSSMRESPERARISQNLFPGERDLGAMITLQKKKGSSYDWIKLDAGIFTGNGINSEFDTKKDFIGHLYFTKANKAETITYGGGISYYNGGVYQGTKYVYYPGEVIDVTQPGLVDSTATNKSSFAKRQYIGFDAQFSIQSSIGITTIRGEYITGQQPGAKNVNASVSTGTLITYDTYIRNISGGYIYLVQGIGQTKNQLVLKYDWLDPNTKVSGTEIVAKSSSGKNTGLGVADTKYTTMGIGWNYRFNAHVKAMVYYEIVKNENTGLSPVGLNRTLDTSKDLKDNVLTVRLQYKF